MATNQQVLDHHLQGLVERNVPMVLEDVTEDSADIVNGKITLQTVGAVVRAK